MTSFQPEKYLVETRSAIFLVEMASFMFLSQYRDTKTIFYLFYKITKVFSSFRDVIHVSVLATEVPGGNRRRRRNNKAQQKTRKIGVFFVFFAGLYYFFYVSVL